MSFDIQQENIVNINAHAPLISFSISSSKFISELIEVVEKIKKERTPKAATVYSVKTKKDVIKSTKRVSNRISTKDSQITDIINKYLFDVIKTKSRHRKYSFTLLDHHYDIVSYEEGGFFKKHRDYQWFYSPGRIQMSCLIGLKDTIKGGGTQIWYPNSYAKFREEKNKLFNETSKKGGVVIFPSHWFHSGETIIEGEKEILFINLSFIIPDNYSYNAKDYFRNTYGGNTIGSRVAIKWAGGTYYNGTVTDYTENGNYKYEITYDDNDVRRYNFTDMRILGPMFVNANGNHHIKLLLRSEKKSEEESITKIITSNKKEIDIDMRCLRNTLLEIEIDFCKLENKDILIDYSNDEIDILIKYLNNYNLPLPLLESYSKNSKYKRKYLDIIQKETGLLLESIKIGLKTNVSTMKMVDNLISKKTKCALWSSYIPWSFNLVNQKNNLIPFVIINEYVDKTHQNTFFSLYNFNLFSEKDISSFKKNLFKNGWFWNSCNLKKSIENFINELQNSHLKQGVTSNSYISVEKKHIIPCKDNDKKTPSKKVTDIKDSSNNWVSIVKKKKWKKKKNVYNIPSIAFNEYFGEIIKEIYNYLGKNSLMVESSTSEVERYKNRYYSLIHNDYDSYSDYESDGYCNGRDDYGGYHRKYATQLITVRYGLYRYSPTEISNKLHKSNNFSS